LAETLRSAFPLAAKPSLAVRLREATLKLRPDLDPEAEALVKRAAAGDKTVLRHPKCATVWVSQRETPLHILATKCVPECLDHPDFAKVQDSFGDTPFHKMAAAVPLTNHKLLHEMLEDEDIAKVRGSNGKTPLHILAYRNCKDIWDVPWAAQFVGSVQDNGQWSPLHWLADHGDPKAAQHQYADHPGLANRRGDKPLDLYNRKVAAQQAQARWLATKADRG
jgi:hypothetical protein